MMMIEVGIRTNNTRIPSIIAGIPNTVCAKYDCQIFPMDHRITAIPMIVELYNSNEGYIPLAFYYIPTYECVGTIVVKRLRKKTESNIHRTMNLVAKGMKLYLTGPYPLKIEIPDCAIKLLKEIRQALYSDETSRFRPWREEE